MADAPHHLETLEKIKADHVAAHYRQVATLGRPAKGLQTSLRIEALTSAIRAIEERDDLMKAVTAFMAKWEQVEPAINAAFVLRQMHVGNYEGPTVADELRAMREAIAKVERTDA